MTILYSRTGTDYKARALEFLYWVSDGTVIVYADKVKMLSGEQAEIKSGRWGLLRTTPSDEFMAELSAGNVRVDRGQLVLIGERKYSENQPTATLEPR